MSQHAPVDEVVVDVYEETEEQATRRRERTSGGSPSSERRGAPSRFLLWSAGVDFDTLALCPYEAPRYLALGVSVVSTAIISGASMALTLTLVVDVAGIVPLVASLGWAAMVFNIDRWLVADAALPDVRGGGRRRSGAFVGMVARLALCLLLGIVVSEPVVLTIYRNEIEVDLYQQRLIAAQEATEQVEESIAEVDAEIDALQARLFEEVSGQGPGGIPGAGPVVAELESAIEISRQQRNDLVEIRAEIDDRVPAESGLLARMEALGRLQEDNSALRSFVWLTRALLILMGSFPAFLSIVNRTRPDTYQLLLQLRVQQQVDEARMRLAMAQRRAEVTDRAERRPPPS